MYALATDTAPLFANYSPVTSIAFASAMIGLILVIVSGIFILHVDDSRIPVMSMGASMVIMFLGLMGFVIAETVETTNHDAAVSEYVESQTGAAVSVEQVHDMLNGSSVFISDLDGGATMSLAPDENGRVHISVQHDQ